MTTINTNIGAITAQANMTRVNEDMNTAMSRLSSGLRINAAKDDAAGMAIAEKMTSQIMGLNQAIRNATDGKNMVDTTEGAHVEVSNMLQRLRELAVQSANDTNTASNRSNLMSEATQLISEINAVSENTSFNGMKVLDGSFTGKQLQVGADSGQVLNIDIDSASATKIGAYTAQTLVSVAGAGTNLIGGDNLTIAGTAGTASITVTAGMSAKDLAAAVNLNAAKTGVEATASTTAALSVAGIPSGGDSVSFAINGTQINAVTLSSTGGTEGLRDAINAVSSKTGVTASMGTTTGEVILKSSTGDDIKVTNFTTADATDATAMTVAARQADGAASSTSAASVTLNDNATPAVASATVVGQVEFTSSKAFTITEAGTAETNGTDFIGAASSSSSLSSVADIDLTTAQGAAEALKVLDMALEKISQSRSDLGAVSNRLDSTISNLTNITVNVEAARSGVMDADFAKESSEMARTKILAQASTAMLAQANKASENVLSLLR